MRPPPRSTLFPYTTLFRSVLAPDSGKALFFGGAVAARRGDLPLARARFVKLLGMDPPPNVRPLIEQQIDRKSTRLNSSHSQISYAVFCLKKKKKKKNKNSEKKKKIKKNINIK